MPLDEKVLARARRFNRRAMQMVIETMYPRVYRLACALAGREDVGRGIVHFVMRRSVRHMRQWRDSDTAERWYFHYTILTARRSAGHQAKLEQDVLITRDPHHSPAYLAFIRALRSLPQQAKEAFILHHGERLDSRGMSIAMDCSIKAAEMHLHTATGTLAPIAGPGFAAMRERLFEAYRAVVPDEAAIAGMATNDVMSAMWPLMLKRLARGVVALAAIGAAAWLAWRLRSMWGEV